MPILQQMETTFSNPFSHRRTMFVYLGKLKIFTFRSFLFFFFEREVFYQVRMGRGYGNIGWVTGEDTGWLG